MSDIKRQLLAELRTINRLFRQHNIGASVHPKQTCIAGSVFISCGITLASGETIERVERRLPELSEAITVMRQTPTPVRSQRMPFALEFPHPKPEPLYPNHGMPAVPAHSMLLGKSFNPMIGAKDEVCTFDDFPHSLVAGTTGAGKSTLVNWMLLSLCRYTSPEELRIVLVDLKNEDLVPFRELPHVVRFEMDIEGATDAINHCHDEVEQRKTQRKSWRLLLVVDELAELATEKTLLHTLGRYLGLGRSKNCNAVLATQYPTSDVLGKLGKPNLPHRLGGLCTDSKTAEIVSARPQSHLHLLPGKGSFIRIHGSHMIRMQTYFLGDGYRQRLIDTINGTWKDIAHSKKLQESVSVEGTYPSTYGYTQVLPTPLPNQNDDSTYALPTQLPTLTKIGTRTPTDPECLAIHAAIADGSMSKSAMQKLLYGGSGGPQRKRLNDALTHADSLLNSRCMDTQTQPQADTNGARIIQMRRTA